MRSATNPRRNNDSFARMLVAVAVASLATMSGAPKRNPTMPDMMQSHHKAPAALALNCGDSSVFDCIMVAVPLWQLVGHLQVEPPRALSRPRSRAKR